MPRPIAAGVFGIARTSAQGADKARGEELQRLAGHDRHHDGRGGDDRGKRRHRLRGDLGLDRNDDRSGLPERLHVGIDRRPRAARAEICGDG